jgi:hypothetical protein
MRRSKCAQSGYCALICPRKGLVSTTKRVKGLEWRGQMAKAQALASKRANLNRGFRLAVVGTRAGADRSLLRPSVSAGSWGRARYKRPANGSRDHAGVDSKSWIEPFRGDMQKPPT